MHRARRAIYVLLLLAGACQAGSSRDGADGRFELTGDRHRAVVTGETLAIGRVDAAAPRTGLGATRAAGLPSARATIVEDEGALTIERGWARERLVNGDDGIEQSWTFAARPPGGDLELCVPTVGLSYLDSDRRGLRFAIDGGDTVLRYGHATWVAGDQRVALPARFRDGCIVLGVPSAVLDAASYPAVLDPVISVEYGLPPADETGPAQGAQENPALVWGDTAHLVAWSDSREATGFPSVYAVLREWSAIPADQAGVRLGPGLLSNTALVPAVAHTDGIFAVAWATYDSVFFVRVDESGHVLDAPARALHVGGSPGALGIAARDGQFFVVWLDRAVSGDLRGTRVTAAGVVLDATPLVLTTDGFEQRDLRLRASPDGYWALFTDDRSGNRDVQLLRLSAAGAPLAAPVAVSTRAGTQRAPDVAFDGDGGAIAVWDDENTAAVHGAKITLAPLTIGADTRITGGSFEAGARIGFADGAYTVAMRSQICGQACPVVLDLPASGPVRVDGEPLADGRSQAVDLAVDDLGVEVVWDETSARTLGADILIARPGDRVVLASRAADTQLLPQAAAMSSHFLAAWLTPRAAGVQVQAARISGLGELEDDAPIQLSGTYPAQGLVGVASLSQTALVVWNERRSAAGSGNPDWRVMASRVNAAGVAETPMQVDSGSSPLVGDLWVNGSFPARFVLTWVDGDVVYDQDIRETGTPAISRFVLEDPSVLDATWIRATLAFVYYFSPTDQRVHRFRRSDGRLDVLDAVGPASSTFLVARRGGDHAIVYQDNRTDPARVSLLVHDDSGAERWRIDGLATGTGTLSPRIIGQSDGYFVIWRAEGGIVGQRISSDGALIDAAPAVISNEPGVEALGAMISDIVGRALVVYSRFVAEPGLNAHRVRSRVIDFRVGEGAGPGATCSSGFACASGYCVDGVCCDEACGFGADDCQACARGAGAPTDGTCAVLAATVVCREADGACDAAETCTGSSPTCPVDAPADAGNACGDRARGDCDADDVCDGVGFACPDVKRPSGAECRASAGVCDPRETCDGASDSCPADRLASGSTCRAATGACDVAEVCDGASAGCPGDAVAPATSVCRASAGACDVVETCDGQAVACPPDVRAIAGTICRAGAGDCDVAEACDGAAAACPDDAYAGPEVQCRDADGACDVAERCGGSGPDCPVDDAALDGTSCADTLGCNGRETCRAGACVAGTPLCGADQTCSEATDVCTPIAPPVEPPAEDGGCGCSADGAGGSTGLWMLLLVLPLARRRRVRSRSRTTGR